MKQLVIYVLTLLLLFSLSGCITTRSIEAMEINLVTKQPAGCENLGRVQGIEGLTDSMSSDRYSSENKMFNKAAKLGATHIQLLEHKQDLFVSTHTGIAYKCTGEKLESETSSNRAAE